jgi:drug/metabolite transporter (DMT)-like permease
MVGRKFNPQVLIGLIFGQFINLNEYNLGCDLLKKFYTGVYLIVLSAIGFGVMPIFALYAYQSRINVATLLLIRFFLSTAVFFSFLWITGKKIKLTRSQILAFFVMGGIFYTLQSTLYFNSLRFISPSLTALLFYTYPIIVSLLSFFIANERLTKRHFFAIIMTSLGLILVLGMSSARINMIGILLAFGAALVYSGYILLGDRLVQQIPSVVSSAFVTFFATLSFFVICLSTQNFHFGFEMKAWFPILGIILFSTIMAISTFFKGLELIGPTTTSILSTLEPLVTIGLSILLFHEKLTGYQLLGSLAVISGAIIVVLAKKMSSSGKSDQIPTTKGTLS